MSELELRLAWERFVAPPGHSSQERYDSVVSRHAEPQRHYHTIDHVVWVLRHLDSFDHPDIDRAAAGAAAFYHDAIYQPGSTDNETDSADLAWNELLTLGWEPERANVVAEIIRSSADHLVGGDLTIAAFNSADLGVLAADPTEYADYAAGVRREYVDLDDRQWRTGRAAFLESVLARPTIFDARIVPADWEQRARANITAELATLN